LHTCKVEKVIGSHFMLELSSEEARDLSEYLFVSTSSVVELGRIDQNLGDTINLDFVHGGCDRFYGFVSLEGVFREESTHQT
jgi:hypothetical protein